MFVRDSDVYVNIDSMEERQRVCHGVQRRAGLDLRGGSIRTGFNLLVEVAWMGTKHLFVRAMNRVQDISRLWLVDAETNNGRVVRNEVDTLYHGRLPILKAIMYLQPNPT